MEESRQLESLKGTVQQGSIMESFVQHPGFQILKRELDRRIEDKKNEWLSARTQEEAEEIRIKTKPLKEVYDLITHKILQGRSAQDTLNKLESEEI